MTIAQKDTAWTRSKRLAAIGAERGLRFKGFMTDLKALNKEFNTWDEYVERTLEEGEESPTEEGYKEWLGFCFEHWFGRHRAVPVAHRVVRGPDTGRGVWDVTIEVYEVENSIEIPDHKLVYYGDLADREGPHFELHILDKYDHEIVIRSEDLMSLWLIDLGTKEDAAAMKKAVRSRAGVQHHTPIVVDSVRTKQLEQETDRLRRELKKIELAQVGNVLQDIIWGIGSQMPHKEIAVRCGVNVTTVRATSLLLASKNVIPHELVKKTQARWKVAYDALRELGISA